MNGVEGTFRSLGRRLFSTSAGAGGGKDEDEGEGVGVGVDDGETSGRTASSLGLATATASGSATAAAAAVEWVPVISRTWAGSRDSRGGGCCSNEGSSGGASSWEKYTTEDDEGRDESAPSGWESWGRGTGCGRRGVPLVRPARSVAARRADLRTSGPEERLAASRATRAAPSSSRRRSLDAMASEGGAVRVDGFGTKKRSHGRTTILQNRNRACGEK